MYMAALYIAPIYNLWLERRFVHLRRHFVPVCAILYCIIYLLRILSQLSSIKYNTIQRNDPCHAPFQEVTKGSFAAHPLQPGHSVTGGYGGLPSGCGTHGESHRLHHRSCGASLLHPRCLPLDADGSHLAVPHVRQGHGDIYTGLHAQDLSTGMGWVPPLSSSAFKIYLIITLKSRNVLQNIWRRVV